MSFIKRMLQYASEFFVKVCTVMHIIVHCTSLAGKNKDTIIYNINN